VLKIRLRRTGARKRPNYRLVVAEATAPRDGQFIEIIGFYDPLTDPATVRIDGDKAKSWLGKGAQPTERVARLFAREGIIAAAPVPRPPASAPAPSAPAPSEPAAAEPAAEAVPEAEGTDASSA
jgi:small subunit ribosomal protein S16